MESSKQKMLRELHVFRKVISSLCDLKLISEDQKLCILEKSELVKMKAEMYDLLVQMDLEIGLKMMLAIRDFGLEKNEISQKIKDCSHNPQNLNENKKPNPLDNAVVLKTLFGFLNLTDIKSFAHVNKIWNDVARPLLRKRATIAFSRSSLHNPAIFTETFGDAQTILPFTSFRFKNDWPISVLTNFLEERKSQIKQIGFQDLTLINERGEVVENYDISQWIDDSLIFELKVGSQVDADLKTILTVSLQSLSSVNFLALSCCKIIVNQQWKITPMKLNLDKNTFLQEGNKLDEICINDYFDLKEATDVSISAYWPEPTTEVLFDFAKLFNIEQLKLDNVQGMNLARHNPNSSVNKLFLANVVLTEKTKMNITELNFCSGVVDLFALPAQLEKLDFHQSGTDQHLQISCTEPITQLKLKILNFATDNYRQHSLSVSILSHFSDCSNLVDIDISNPNSFIKQSRDIILNLMWLPRSIKRLKITGLEKITPLDGRRKLILETLVFDKCNLSEAADILAKIIPNTLVMEYNTVSKDLDCFLRFLQQFKCLENFLIGPFNWKDVKYEENQLCSYFNEKARYYLFQNQEGISIDENYFYKLANFNQAND